MEVAIRFQRIKIGDNSFIFKPNGVIKGEELQDNIFISEDNQVYYNISIDSFEENFYYDVTTTKKLKEKYGKNKRNNEILEQYLCDHQQYLYYATYNINGDYNLYTLPFNNIVEGKIESTLEDPTDIVIDLDNLLENFELETLYELKAKINELISPFEKLDKESTKEEKQKSTNKVELSSLRKNTFKDIIGQDKAVNDISRSIMINLTSKDVRNKVHMLVVGPTGTGKTEIINNISKQLNIPCFEADATAYTKEGYVGKSLYSMFTGLINAANGDISVAQNGILIIDEIDKKLSKTPGDPGGSTIFKSMLKLLERKNIEVEIKNGYREETVMFDTSNVIFIFMGSFQDLYDKKIQDSNKIMGFSNSKNEKVTDYSITKDDLIKAGVPAEFIGRIEVLTNTLPLTKENLINILKNSEISPLIITKKYFKDNYNIEIDFTEEYIDKIAQEAVDSKTNARDLKSKVMESMTDIYDAVLSGYRTKKIVVDVKELTKEQKVFIKK